jgi:hypothetical protein
VYGRCLIAQRWGVWEEGRGCLPASASMGSIRGGPRADGFLQVSINATVTLVCLLPQPFKPAQVSIMLPRVMGRQ